VDIAQAVTWAIALLALVLSVATYRLNVRDSGRRRTLKPRLAGRLPSTETRGLGFGTKRPNWVIIACRVGPHPEQGGVGAYEENGEAGDSQVAALCTASTLGEQVF
jgi:hypothetical protein